MSPRSLIWNIILILITLNFVPHSVSNGEIQCLCSKEIPSLPNYSSIQVGQHASISTRIWMSYQSGVYDITDFIDKHPGGVSPLLASAGGNLEPYWNVLPVHKKERVYAILEQFRVGNLDVSDRRNYTMDPFSKEKNRSHVMDVISEEPYNAEAKSADLLKSFITPNELHYVRLHFPIPWITNIDGYQLTIGGIGIDWSKIITLEDIKKQFTKQTLTATLQCSGNRRAEMNKIKLTHGVAYKHTGISTASWGGVFLLDLFKKFEIPTTSPSLKFVNFEGSDQDLSGINYGASIPSDMALDPQSDLFLAYEMNGVPIPPDHGFPLRLIASGMAGFRSVKFLSRITLAEAELGTLWEDRFYKFFSSKYTWGNIDYNSAPGLYYTNVQSAILSPVDGESVLLCRNGGFDVMGYAFSGGGNGIAKVEVTTDGGMSWTEAVVTNKQESSWKRHWTWIFWKASISLDSGERCPRNLSVSCRAFDSSYNSQPKDVATIWNLMGVLVNHWHTINVTIKVSNATN